MAEILSRLDLFEIGRQYVLTRNQRIDPENVDTEGSDVNLFIGSQSFVAHAVSRQLAERISALLLDGAEDEDLDRYAWDRYQLTRKGAAAALVNVQLTRPTNAGGAGTVPVGTRLRTLTGIEYVMVTSTSFGATDLASTSDPQARAAQAGKQYQVGANQIRRFDNVALLFDTTIEVNNSSPASGGEPVEGDDVFRERIRDFWNTARRGTLAAIEFGARTVSGVESALAVEALDGQLRPARVVQLYIADSSGVASAALAAQVNVQLDEYRAAGITVLTQLGIPQIIDIVLDLTFRAGVDTTTLSDEIAAAVLGFINSLGVNQTLYIGELRAVLARFKNSGLVPDDSSVVEPAGDLVPDLGRTLRVRPANVVVL